MPTPSRFTYKCTNCNARTSRDNLTVKKAVFLRMGEGGATIKSRVVQWLCKACLLSDEDFNRPTLQHNKEVTK